MIANGACGDKLGLGLPNHSSALDNLVTEVRLDLEGFDHAPGPGHWQQGIFRSSQAKMRLLRMAGDVADSGLYPSLIG